MSSAAVPCPVPLVRSVSRDAPNLRQVHLIAEGFLAEAAEHGYDVEPGDLGDLGDLGEKVSLPDSIC